MLASAVAPEELYEHRVIARRAGVSRSTVSYALSGKRPVAAATRKRIQDVIDELGYRPNATARALKEGRTRTIGLVIPPAGGPPGGKRPPVDPAATDGTRRRRRSEPYPVNSRRLGGFDAHLGRSSNPRPSH
jgi:transcriptional regulator with XRE-family HTH domain